MRLPFSQIDAFASAPFAGNPAAVIPLTAWLDDAMLQVEKGSIEVAVLDSALRCLAEIDSRKSRVVELRYFGGLSLEETAEVLGVSQETAKRDWKMAKTWLFGELRTSAAT